MCSGIGWKGCYLAVWIRWAGRRRTTVFSSTGCCGCCGVKGGVKPGQCGGVKVGQRFGVRLWGIAGVKGLWRVAEEDFRTRKQGVFTVCFTEFDGKGQVAQNATFELHRRRRKCNANIQIPIRHDLQKRQNGKMVGARGFEPPTPWSRTRCATRLRYAPNVCCGVMPMMAAFRRAQALGWLAGSPNRLG